MIFSNEDGGLEITFISKKKVFLIVAFTREVILYHYHIPEEEFFKLIGYKWKENERNK